MIWFFSHFIRTGSLDECKYRSLRIHCLWIKWKLCSVPLWERKRICRHPGWYSQGGFALSSVSSPLSDLPTHLEVGCKGNIPGIIDPLLIAYSTLYPPPMEAAVPCICVVETQSSNTKTKKKKNVRVYAGCLLEYSPSHARGQMESK